MDNPEGQDWNAAMYFVIHGADPSTFTMTIEDTSGVARDFAFSESLDYRSLTKSEMEQGVSLPNADQDCC